MEIDMKAGEANVGMKEVVSNLTVEVKLTGVKVFLARLWVGKIFFYIGAKIIGCEIEIKTVQSIKK